MNLYLNCTYGTFLDNLITDLINCIHHLLSNRRQVAQVLVRIPGGHTGMSEVVLVPGTVFEVCDCLGCCIVLFYLSED